MPPRVILVVREYIAFTIKASIPPGQHYVALGTEGRTDTDPLTQTRVSPATAGIPNDLGEAESIVEIERKGYVQKGEARESVSSFHATHVNHWCVKTRDVTYHFERPPPRAAPSGPPTGTTDTAAKPM